MAYVSVIVSVLFSRKERWFPPSSTNSKSRLMFFALSPLSPRQRTSRSLEKKLSSELCLVGPRYLISKLHI
jgi:hypothetical protein